MSDTIEKVLAGIGIILLGIWFFMPDGRRRSALAGATMSLYAIVGVLGEKMLPAAASGFMAVVFFGEALVWGKR